MSELLIKSKFKSQKSKIKINTFQKPVLAQMTKKIIKILLPGIFIFWFAVSGFSFYEILESNTVKEGGIIKVKIGAPQSAKAADIIFLGQNYPAFFKGYELKERQLVYTAMVPVPLGTSGREKLIVRCLIDTGIAVKEEKIKVKKLKEEKSEVDTAGQMGAELLDVLGKENKIIHAYVEKVTPVKYELPFLMPVQGEISTNFGASRDYDKGVAAWRHKGIDIAAKEGTSVKASNNGTVVMAARGKAYGNSVIIDHGGGIFTLYFHLQKMYVKIGYKVAKGDIIGAVGHTGLATGPHLHFQTDLFKVPVNPNELIGPADEEPAGVSGTAGV
jgi:murein DD-endopeptidase MepM/ murein hydrolase activator NlpD